MPIDDMLSNVATDFDRRWKEGSVTRWQSGKASADAAAQPEINLATVQSAQELEGLGMDALKVCLLARIRLNVVAPGLVQ